MSVEFYGRPEPGPPKPSREILDILKAEGYYFTDLEAARYYGAEDMYQSLQEEKPPARKDHLVESEVEERLLTAEQMEFLNSMEIPDPEPVPDDADFSPYPVDPDFAD